MPEDNRDTIVLEPLRIMRNENQETRTSLENRLDRLETRMSGMEHMMGHMYPPAQTTEPRHKTLLAVLIGLSVGSNFAMTPNTASLVPPGGQ